MMAQKIQDLKILSNLNRSNNFNDILNESIKKENMRLLESTLSNTPRTARNDIITSTNSRKRRFQHPKVKTVSQLNHPDSGANPYLDLLNNSRTEKSANDSSVKLNSSMDHVIYNLIEYHGDDSAKSEYNIQNISNSNSEMVKINQQSVLEAETKFVSVSVPANKSPKRIVFLIPAELEASVEILRVQSIASVNTQVQNSLLGDKLFSNINLPTSTTLLSPISNAEVSDFIGPIKNKMKKIQKKRKAHPYYARRGNAQNRQQENHRQSVEESSNTRNSTLNELKFEIPESYVPRDFQQTHSSVGPIRSKTYRNSLYKQASPLRSYSNSPYNMPSPNRNTRITSGNHSTRDDVQPATTIDHQYTQHSVDPYSGSRNDRNKPYHNSKFRRIKLCWNCQSNSHLLRQCPLL